MKKMIFATAALTLAILAAGCGTLHTVPYRASDASWDDRIHQSAIADIAARTGFPEDILEHEYQVLAQGGMPAAQAMFMLGGAANSVHQDKGTVAMLDYFVKEAARTIHVLPSGQIQVGSSAPAANVPEWLQPKPSTFEAQPKPAPKEAAQPVFCSGKGPDNPEELLK
jgi:hypothetical protein